VLLETIKVINRKIYILLVFLLVEGGIGTSAHLKSSFSAPVTLVGETIFIFYNLTAES
jgi:hypothetical protein